MLCYGTHLQPADFLMLIELRHARSSYVGTEKAISLNFGEHFLFLSCQRELRDSIELIRKGALFFTDFTAIFSNVYKS